MDESKVAPSMIRMESLPKPLTTIKTATSNVEPCTIKMAIPKNGSSMTKTATFEGESSMTRMATLSRTRHGTQMEKPSLMMSER